MGEIIRDWLRTRLGVIIDLSPEIFGHHARDGTLLAKLLHSYDIINDSQLNTLLHTQDPALSRVNLKHLRIWLRFIGIDCDLESIEDISNGKGITALRLFYKVFLCLENKDRLHFITLQKEREKYIPSSSRFDVTTISEEPDVTQAIEENALAVPLKKNGSLIEWQRKKYGELIDFCRKDREKFRASQEEKEVQKGTSDFEKGEITIGRRRGKSLLEESEKRELDEFAKKHRVTKFKEPVDPCEQIVRRPSTSPKSPCVDREAARVYTKSLKSKHRQEALARGFKTRLQKNLLSDLWKKVLDDQEMEFDEIVARKVLHQSQYEKQMMRKLCDVRSQKSRMTGNRQIVENLLEKTRENEFRLEQERAREVMVRESEEVEAESRRIHELERRIEEQKKKKKREKFRRLGERIVNDIVDISLRTGEYKITSKQESVPESLMNEWKALFFKSQPIFEPFESFVAISQEHTETDVERVEEENETRIEVLNDEDFENYHNVRLIWKDFLPSIDEEVQVYLNLGLNVLGYIVHRVLEGLGPQKRKSMVEPLPRMRTRAAIVGIPGTLLYEPIQELLRNRKIRLIRMEEAVNHCLERYKEEMKDLEYIDLEIIAATREALSPSTGISDVEEQGKRGKRKSATSRAKVVSSLQRMEVSKSGIDKVTQTPRVIPHEDMDPSLSDAAYIGKWTHEFLTLGQPISDELSAKILVEYLKSLKDIEGFVVANYPTTYEQTSTLEFVLTGQRLSENRRKYSSLSDGTNIEDIDPIPSRISFEDESDNSLGLLKRSRLLPNPIEALEQSEGKSYLTAFVRLKPKPESYEEKNKDDIWEILSEDADSMDAYYVEQEIASILYYVNFDLTTLKSLVRLAIGERDTSTSRLSSVELFGEAFDYLDGGRESSTSKAPIVKRLLPRPASCSSMYDESEISGWSESRRDVDKEPIVSMRMHEGPSLPGEVEWSWASFSQPPSLVESLANFWHNLEVSYIENLKDLFHLRRTCFGGLVHYQDYVTRHMNEFIERPDRKQDLLHDFHRAFNEIDEDIRDEEEVKRELCCRIDDFETRLWEICDLRRREAEDERRRIIHEHWTTMEEMVLDNFYIGALQAEIDRFNDTLQFVQDYYLSMLQRPLQEIRSRVTLKKIHFEPETSISTQEIALTGNVSTKSVKGKPSKESKTTASSAKIPAAPSSPEVIEFKEETARLFIEGKQANFIPAQTICYKTVEASVHYVQDMAESMAISVLEMLKKEENSVSKPTGDSKEKKRSSKRVSRQSKTDQSSGKKQTQDLILEWRYALMYEINRIRVRTKMLESAARADVNFLVGGMQNFFLDMEKNLTDRYEREVKSVNEMASTFRFAVEEATAIQEELLLDGDRFVVRSNVLMFPDKPEPDRPPTREMTLPSRFTISQLCRLMDIFRRLAPNGNLAERSFVYVLQDLIVCHDELGEIPLLPPSWFELRACDVPKLIDRLFGDAEFIDWREFIIYALEIEMPSFDQLINVLEAFRKIDNKSEGLISFEDFWNVELWFFFNGIENDEARSSSILRENVEIDENWMSDEETHILCDWSQTKSVQNFNITTNDTRPEVALRFKLAKKLLCEMFSSDRQSVNYIALLMTFCKDEQPELGLGKALSLAVGNKICVDWEDGQEYARERIMERIRVEEARLAENDLREEATKISGAILNNLLKGVQKTCATDVNGVETITRQDGRGKAQRSSIRIEKLDASTEFVNLPNLFPPGDNTPVSRLSDETERAEISEERRSRGLSVTINLPEEHEMKKPSWTQECETVYWLSFDVCQSVLAAMLPNLTTQRDILESGKSLRENLELAFLELRDENLDEGPDVILAHRFLDNDFVKKILAQTSKFTTKHMGDELESIIRNKNRNRNAFL